MRRPYKQQAAIAARHRKSAKVARKTNQQRAKRAVKALERDLSNHAARMTKLALLSVDTRARYARQQMTVPVLLPAPLQRFLPDWKPNIWKPEQIEENAA